MTWPTIREALGDRLDAVPGIVTAFRFPPPQQQGNKLPIAVIYAPEIAPTYSNGYLSAVYTCQVVVAVSLPNADAEHVGDLLDTLAEAMITAFPAAVFQLTPVATLTDPPSLSAADDTPYGTGFVATFVITRSEQEP